MAAPYYYKTKQGDTWDGIAYLMFGDEAYMQALMRLNRTHINTLVFDAGVMLELPERTAAIAPGLPLWKG